MAKRGRRGSKRLSSARTTECSDLPARALPLRNPSQALSDSRSRKTKSSGPSSPAYRMNVLRANKITFKSVNEAPEDIQILVKSLRDCKNTLMYDDNDFIEDLNDSRITSDEYTLTVNRDIPSRMRDIVRRLPDLDFASEAIWNTQVADPLMSTFKDAFFVSGGKKWDMIYVPPNEALPLSVPVPDTVYSIKLAQPDAPGNEFGIDERLLEKLEEKRIRYSASSIYLESIYPFLILELKSSSGNMQYAENQLGSSVANALTLLRRLCEEAHSDKELPIFALTSQGNFWSVYIAHERLIRNQRRIIIYKFLHVDITFPEGAHQIMVVLDRIKQWAMNAYVPTIREMIRMAVSTE